jgi:hypothetical protein
LALQERGILNSTAASRTYLEKQSGIKKYPTRTDSSRKKRQSVKE